MKYKKRYLIMIFLLLPILVSAQKGLEIDTIFDSYGKQEGSVLIELAKDVLGGHSAINFYKSLIMPSDTTIVKNAEKAIFQDIAGGGRMMESKKDGYIETGYYCLKKEEDAPEYEYILFKNKSEKMTLIYLKGNFPPQQLERELNRLKDLFIKVNNKRIKLQ